MLHDTALIGFFGNPDCFNHQWDIYSLLFSSSRRPLPSPGRLLSTAREGLSANEIFPHEQGLWATRNLLINYRTLTPARTLPVYDELRDVSCKCKSNDLFVPFPTKIIQKKRVQT
jgi:hypothetical protein